MGINRSIFIILILFCYQVDARVIDPKEFDQYFKLLPKPQKTELLTGPGLEFTALRAMHLKGVARRPALDQPLSYLPIASSKGPGVLTLELSDNEAIPTSPEGYILEVAEGQVSVIARTDAGIFYGCQTLLQLIEDARDQQISIPACRVTDFPGIPYRAVHWDLKYHLDAGHYYYEMIDRLARIKVNAVIVEFEDKLRYTKDPLVGAAHAISVEEFAAISRYARDRHIEISPLVQGLGHVSFILKHEKYKNLRDDPNSDWVIDPLNPATYDLQFSLYDDAIKATPNGKYLHVGGDEVYNLGRSELARKSGMKPFELQMYWLNKVCEYARQHNRIPIFWDDMLFQLSGLWQTISDGKMSNEEIEKLWAKNLPRLNENVHLFPKDCIYMRWEYSKPKSLGNLKALDWFKSHGLKVMSAPASQSMSAMMPRENSLFQPVKDFCEITTKKKLDGILTTAWDDSSPHFETYWRGFYDFAALTWHYEDVKAEAAHQTFRHRFYAPALSDARFEFQDSLEVALTFWDSGLINTKRQRNRYPKKDDSISLPVTNNGKKWSKKYESKIALARLEIPRYEIIRQRIITAESLATRNHYALALLRQMNELQIYPAQLILLLDDYDHAASADGRKKAADAVNKHVDGFAEIRRKYEDVFSQTRFLNNPEGYILDQNNDNMLANGSNTSSWLFVHELTFNSHVKKWLKEIQIP